MEGTRDGHADDTCFHCALLCPGEAPCPECGNKLRYRPAEIASTQTRPERLRTLWRDYEREKTRERLVLVLECVHAGLPESLEALEAMGVSLQALRSAFRAITSSNR